MTKTFTKILAFTISACWLLGCENKSTPDQPALDGPINYELSAGQIGPEHIKLIETSCGITLPPGSHGQNFIWEGIQLDPSLLAKVEIPADSAQSFANTVNKFTPIATSPGAPPSPGFTSSKTAWWQPDLKTALVDRKTIQTDNSFLHIIVCREGDRWFVYIEWMSV